MQSKIASVYVSTIFKALNREVIQQKAAQHHHATDGVGGLILVVRCTPTLFRFILSAKADAWAGQKDNGNGVGAKWSTGYVS